MSGFFNLNTPADLLEKLDRERKHMEADPGNVDHAFNFFVSAEHMLDWLYPGHEGKGYRESLRRKYALLQVTSHLANGAKHFDRLAKHHSSVVRTERAGGYFAAGWVGKRWFGKGYFAEPNLFIELSSDEADKLGDRPSAVELADAVYCFWSSRLDDA